MAIIYVNRQFVRAEDAFVQVGERGFLFGDGVFETIRIAHGRPYLWCAHLARLGEGLAALRIPAATATLAQLPAICERLIAENGLEHGILRIYISRGTGSRGYLPQIEGEPSLVAQTYPLPAPSPPVRLWQSRMEKISPAALPTHAKLALLGTQGALALLEAADHDCAEALLCTAAGQICEAASANLFWLRDGVLHTPSLATGCLPGTVRARLLHWPRYRVQEGEYPPAALAEAEAVFLTNSARLAFPVSEIQPQDRHWQSEALATEATHWLQQDIDNDTAALRW